MCATEAIFCCPTENSHHLITIKRSSVSQRERIWIRIRNVNFGSGSDPAKSFGSFRIQIRNTDPKVIKWTKKLVPYPILTSKNAFLIVGLASLLMVEAGGSGVEGAGGFTSMSSITPGCMITIGSIFSTTISTRLLSNIGGLMGGLSRGLVSILRLGKKFHFSSPDETQNQNYSKVGTVTGAETAVQ